MDFSKSWKLRMASLQPMIPRIMPIGNHFAGRTKSVCPPASGNSADGQQGDIIELFGFADIILQAFGDSINQISGARWRFF